MTRLLTGLALFAALLATIALGPPGLFAAVAAVAAGVSAWEAYRLLEAKTRPLTALGCLATMAVVACWQAPAPALIAATLSTLTLAMARRPDPAAMLDTTLGTLFPVLWIGLSLSYAAAIRGLAGEEGRGWLLMLLLAVVGSDSTAYYVGRAWGRRPMAPSLSPKKTWEGAAGGIAGSLAGAVVARVFFLPEATIPHTLAVGLLIGGSAMVGDLAESMVKRAVGIKDASGLLPGHGGLLDRADSLLFAVPVLYYYRFFFLDGGMP